MARHLVYHHRELAELNPRHDECPAVCAETGEERASACNDCEVKHLQESFREDCRAEIEERCGDEARDWSFESLESDVLTAMMRSRIKGRRYPRGATALEARLIDIVRGERMRAERIDLWERRQELKRKRNG